MVYQRPFLSNSARTLSVLALVEYWFQIVDGRHSEMLTVVPVSQVTSEVTSPTSTAMDVV